MNTKVQAAKHTQEQEPKDKFMDDLRSVIEDATELLHDTSNQTDEGVVAARARTNQRLQDVIERLVTAEEVVVERTKQAAKTTDQYVHENPWKSIGISACLGAIIGMLIARR